MLFGAIESTGQFSNVAVFARAGTNCSRLSGSISFESFVHVLNAAGWILLTLSGSSIVSMDSHFWNAFGPISTHWLSLANLTVLSAEQLLNIPSETF